jgi:hypothetical protein
MGSPVSRLSFDPRSLEAWAVTDRSVRGNACQLNAYREGDGVFKNNGHALLFQAKRTEAAARRLLPAHRRASLAAVQHLHERVSEAAERAGLDSGGLTVGWTRGVPQLGIQAGTAGDRLFDHEFGTHEHGPNPVLRTAARAARPGAQQRYEEELRRGLGL